MPIEVRCPCGQVYQVKSELAGKRVRCKKCGGAITVPAEVFPTSVDEFSTAGADPFQMNFELENIKDLPGLGRKCPNCTVPLEPHAVFCVRCGFNLKTGMQVKSVRDPTAGEYRPSIKQTRVAFSLIGGMILLVGVLIFAIAVSDEDKTAAVVPGIVLMMMGGAGCAAAFIAASEIRIERSPQGQVEIIQSRGLGPLRLVRRYDARAFDAVWFVQVAARGRDNTVLLCLMLLLLCFGVVPGLIWWALMFRRNEASVSYRVELRKEGQAPITLLRGGEDAKEDANAIARLIENAANLPREQELGLFNTGKLGF